MTLEKRLAKLEARQGVKAACVTPAQRDALDRLAAAIASGGEAEARARRDLAEMLLDFHL